MKLKIFIVLVICVLVAKSTQIIAQTHDSNAKQIPIGGNAWTYNGGKISEQGFSDWENTSTICRTYFKTSQQGTLKLSIIINTNGSKSKLKVSIQGKSIEIIAENNTEKEVYVGEWNIRKAGYIAVDMSGITKTTNTFGQISNLIVSGSAISEDLAFVKNNDGNFFYWGRRGPSVHLRYPVESSQEVEWFYNEITVPKGNDVIGSYFMANGFGEGYFGMQVNSTTERRVLFSVWSPFNTDNPKTIPQDQKIILLKKGEGVYTGEFGNEGSGGQSFLKYNWIAGNTYKFLLQGKPLENNYTLYTAYFFAPEENQWRLIASFKRPKTTTYLKNLYSFLENFIPETGNQERMAYFDNQWICNSKGEWTELNKISLTADNTARKAYRLDYSGGLKNDRFFLRNCGFFDDNTPLNQTFQRTLQNKKPSIDFSKLL
ncbi:MULTISPECIES: DUF3472 domain-containing protein [Emticicia]|uniref:DUF3472 domain-containing protein n=1 Tax=Emticicia TaxID=312278 RepID=UPI0007D8A136|nr:MULTISPECIES: DUF3472 domain-containing protein [Emticicia]